MNRKRLDDATLIEYAAGGLSAPERRDVEHRLQHDREAAATVQRYQFIAEAHATDESVEPPADVINRARAIFEAPKAATARSLLETTRTVIAQLMFDSRVQPAAVRSAGTRQQVHLSYASDEIELDLQATRQGDAGSGGWRVIGQLAGDQQLPQVRLSVLSGDAVISEQEFDGMDPFTLELPSGTYELRADLQDNVIVFPDITLS